MTSGNDVSLHILMCLNIFMVQGGYKAFLRGCTGIKHQPALFLKHFNKAHICLLTAGVPYNPLSSCHTTHQRVRVCVLWVNLHDWGQDYWMFTVWSDRVTSYPHHRAAVSVWQISRAELILILIWSCFPPCWSAIKGSIVLITEDCAHLAP